MLWPAENLASRRLPKGAINSRGHGVFSSLCNETPIFTNSVTRRKGTPVARYDREHGQATRPNALVGDAQTSTRESGREAMRSDQR